MGLGECPYHRHPLPEQVRASFITKHYNQRKFSSSNVWPVSGMSDFRVINQFSSKEINWTSSHREIKVSVGVQAHGSQLVRYACGFCLGRDTPTGTEVWSSSSFLPVKRVWSCYWRFYTLHDVSSALLFMGCFVHILFMESFFPYHVVIILKLFSERFKVECFRFRTLDLLALTLEPKVRICKGQASLTLLFLFWRVLNVLGPSIFSVNF